jgi:two-component system chemotaxis response regulator CheB
MDEKKIKVLVVEDSPSVQHWLVHLINSDPKLEVVGMVSSGLEALQWLAVKQADVVTMDVIMPKMDGFETTRRIMETKPMPVVIVSAVWRPEEVATTFRAVEAGALAVVLKPGGPDHPDSASDARRLIETVKSMSEVKVVRRRPRDPGAAKSASFVPSTAARANINLVAIGASTGGPTVLQTILAALPKDMSAPVLVVQHIAPGFVDGLVHWLADSTGFPIRLAEAGEIAMPATAYFAPDGRHLGINAAGKIVLSSEPPDEGLQPSVARLFTSVAASYGSRAAGVLLTGMGRDGSQQLLLMRQRGALTIAQDQESSLVFGMPAEAIKLGAAEYVLPPDRIAALLAIAVRSR